MKIALFSPTTNPKDGYGNITFELTQQLCNMGLDVTLFLPEKQKEETAELHLPCATQCVLPGYIFRMYQREGWKYFRTVDVSGFDIVHSLFAFPYCFPAMRSAKKYGKPFMMGAQGTHGVRPLTYRPERWLLKQCYKHAAAIQVPSEYTKQQILRYAKTQYPIDIIHNGVRFERFQHDVADRITAIRNMYDGKKILTTVGGLWGRKGHDLVIRALENIRAHRDDVVYVIVGDGNAKEDLQQLAKRCGVEDAVDFVGRKSGDDLVAHFKACDIYVHTPKVIDLKFEGFGIVYIEASACGKPIVATDAGGIRDAVVDGETGLIAPDENIEIVARHIETLLDDPQRAAMLGANGEKYAKMHDWPRIAEQYTALYERILSEAPSK